MPFEPAGGEVAVLGDGKLMVGGTRGAEKLAAGHQPAGGLAGAPGGEVAVDGEQAMDAGAHAAGPLEQRRVPGHLVVGEDGPQRDGGAGGDAGDVHH